MRTLFLSLILFFLAVSLSGQVIELVPPPIELPADPGKPEAQPSQNDLERTYPQSPGVHQQGSKNTQTTHQRAGVRQVATGFSPQGNNVWQVKGVVSLVSGAGIIGRYTDEARAEGYGELKHSGNASAIVRSNTGYATGNMFVNQRLVGARSTSVETQQKVSGGIVADDVSLIAYKVIIEEQLSEKGFNLVKGSVLWLFAKSCG